MVCHKGQVQGVSHLHPLRMLPYTAQWCIRAVGSGGERVKVPCFRSCQHQRTYVYTTRTLWLRNMFTVATSSMQDMSTQQVKLVAHRWRSMHLSQLVLQNRDSLECGLCTV